MATKGAKTPKKKTASSKAETKKSSKKPSLEAQLEELTHSVEQEKEKFLRLFAEFENFKKRTAKGAFGIIQNCQSRSDCITHTRFRRF
jgi:molecular chaperone GrpE